MKVQRLKSAPASHRRSTTDAGAPGSRRGALVAIAVGLLGLLLLGLALFLAPSDEERVRAVLVRLESAVRVSPGAENPVARIGRINREFSEIVSDGAELHLPEYGKDLRGRRALAELAIGAGAQFSRFQVELTDLEIAVAADGKNASVQGTAAGEGISAGERWRQRRPIRIELERPQDDFLIRGIEVEEIDAEP